MSKRGPEHEPQIRGNAATTYEGGRGDVDALLAAAQKGDAIKVNQLLAKGVDINGPASRSLIDVAGQTALICRRRRRSDRDGTPPSHQRCELKCATCSRRYGTHRSSTQGHLEIVKELLKAGADPNVIVGNMQGSLYTALMYG